MVPQSSSIVITGCGVISSIGSGVDDFSKGLFSSLASYEFHKLLPSDGHVIHKVAYVDDRLLTQGICPRQVRKLDRFCLLTMQAFQEAYAQSSLSPDSAYPFGIFLGNSTGGWSFVEHQMDAVYSGNMDALSPYVATAWFPTAPQGEISIKHKISGCSKTFSSGSLSSGYALEHAMYSIRNGYLPGAFVGGGESPLSPLVYNAYVHTKELSLNGKYLPYQVASQGSLLGEGASVLAIESYGHCLQRGGDPLVNIVHCGIGKNLKESIEECLEQGKKRASDIDAILLDGKGFFDSDQSELHQLSLIFSGLSDIFFGVSRPLYGNTLGADFAFQLLVSVLMLKNQSIPAGVDRIDEVFSKACCGHFVLNASEKRDLRTLLTYSVDRLTGASVAVLLEL